ncbi:MAG: alpha-galactosidase [Rikenellaceae bacterium]|nr:alpha-galactosidase [Rikenellaceae bacterium]
MKKLLLLSVVMLCASMLSAQRMIDVDGKVVPAEKHVAALFAKGKTPPFSFKLDGVSSSEFIRSWRRELRQKDSESVNVLKYEVVYTAPDGSFSVVCDVLSYVDFNAIEWTLHLKNNSSTKNSPQITELLAADYELCNKKGSQYTLYTLKGSHAQSSDFQLRKIVIESDSIYHHEPYLGRPSSKTAFPFYNISNETSGVMFSIGWTGSWFADFQQSAVGNLSVESGMPEVDLYLLPEEQIRTPKISLLWWQGSNRMDGNNLFRRFVLAHHSPRDSKGEMIQPPLCSGFDYDDPDPCNEYSCFTELLARAVVERQAQFKIIPEVFWLDAAWYEGAGTFNGGRSWYRSVGTWEADKARFPNGLRAIADDVHKHGADFMVWFEPERVYKDSKIYNEHPEWLLRDGDSPHYLLNLGDKRACAWLINYMCNFFEQNGIDHYRQDFNIGPSPFWAAADEPKRKGMTQIRYVEGLYAYLDALRERFPDMLIDNCASGGRRFDLEMIDRSMPLWRTDCHYGEPNCQQCHMYGLSQFLPLSGTGTFHADVYCTRSSLSSAYAWFGEVFGRTSNLTVIQNAMAEYRKLRHYFLGDFYPLTGDEDLTEEDTWIAYQCNMSESGSGIVAAFRRPKNTEPSLIVKLCGLDPAATYELRNLDLNQTLEATGASLMSGYEIYLANPRSAAIIEYNKKSE